MHPIVQAVATFAAMGVLDFVWADYTKATVDKQPLRSAGLSAAIVALNSLVVLSYADNHLMIAPAVAGAFLGTFLSVRRH